MLIGLSGPGGSGKDAVAGVLVEEHGFKQLALATKMKEAALALNPIIDYCDGEYRRLSDIIEIFGPEKAKEFEEVRRTYQRMGTEVGRKTIDPQLWIKLVFALVRDRRQDSDIVISDVRFLNEAQYIGARGYVWRISRPDNPNAIKGEVANHISETELTDDTEGLYDHFLVNDGTLGDLSEKVAYGLKACGR